jgi:nucleoside 2-deoxyribosyltransferase
MNRLRCFIAMRFGETQTDKVYNRLIKPAVKHLEIVPIRIDRVEHNDNIDQRIMRELKECDLAIADLTFARPSVYFEAGYAERKVPVIYTSRKDHLKPHDFDTYGNFRVHFDLQMRNIIPWRSEKDADFARRLKARIKKVVRPILLERANREAANEAADRFSRLSIQSRVRAVREIGSQELRTSGFREAVIKPSFYPSAPLFAKGATVVSLSISYATKANLEWEHRSSRNAFDDFPRQDSRKGKTSSPAHVTANWVICSFKKMKTARLHEIFPYITQQSGSATYLFADPFLRGNISVYMHVIDEIKSEDDFRTRMKLLTRTICEKR